MGNDITKKETQPQDGFGWEPDIESTGGEVTRPMRSMAGEVKLKFVDPDWSADGVDCNGRTLVCYDKTYSVIRWGDDKKPLETIPLARGEPCPDVNAMNSNIPKEQWRIAFGKPEAPYQLQRCLEFLDPVSMERLSWPHNVLVAGSSRAAEELEGKVKTVRRLRGENLYPKVRLEHKTMPTRDYGPIERPFLAVVGWVRLGQHGIEDVNLNAPVQRPAQLPPQSAPPTQSTTELPLAEEMADEVKF
jgi:hypothetical protein